MDEPIFKRPELEDKELISSYFNKAPGRSCERTFVNVYLWSRHYRVKFAVVQNALVFTVKITASLFPIRQEIGRMFTPRLII